MSQSTHVIPVQIRSERLLGPAISFRGKQFVFIPVRSARRNQASQHHLATSEHVPGELQIVVNGYCGGSAPFIYVLTFGIMRRYIGSLEVMGPVIRSEAATASICGSWNAIKTHQHNKLTSPAVKRGRSVIYRRCRDRPVAKGAQDRRLFQPYITLSTRPLNSARDLSTLPLLLTFSRRTEQSTI